MKKLTISILLIICGIYAYGQQTVPAAVAVPDGSTLVLHVYAKGVQVYRCVQDAKDTTKYVWLFQEPKAELFKDAAYTQKSGKHYLSAAKSPTWQLTDGSIISGIKLRQAGAPDGVSIPWLLLTPVAESAKGILAPVKFIQRLYTSGGAAPSTASSAQKGQTLQVPYTAEYFFYK